MVIRMSQIEDQVVETWRVHNRVCLFMIENIPEKALTATLSTRGGRDIARQLAHLHNVRVWRLKAFARRTAIKLSELDPEKSPGKKNLLDAFKQSGSAMEQYVEECVKGGGAVPNFKRGVVPMVGYYIAHEAHHRGSILLTMKKAGITLPAALKWGIWEWNKR